MSMKVRPEPKDLGFEAREAPWRESKTAEPSDNRRGRSPIRRPNAAYRRREYLTEAEVETLINAARKRSRSLERDAAAILLAYRHGLRAAELT